MEKEMLGKIQDTLSQALGIEKDDIRLESSLVRDLGAESIDFIDIIFRLEKAFDLKIPSGDLFPGNIMTDERFVSQGRVTPAGIQELKAKIPYMDVDAFSKDPQIAKLGDYFTVQMILNYLKGRLAKDAKV